MADFAPGTFVRVLAYDQNHGKLGVVVEPRLLAATPKSGHVWVEMAHLGAFGGIYRALYHVNALRVADELDTHR